MHFMNRVLKIGYPVISVTSIPLEIFIPSGSKVWKRSGNWNFAHRQKIGILILGSLVISPQESNGPSDMGPNFEISNANPSFLLQIRIQREILHTNWLKPKIFRPFMRPMQRFLFKSGCKNSYSDSEVPSIRSSLFLVESIEPIRILGAKGPNLV